MRTPVAWKILEAAEVSHDGLRRVGREATSRAPTSGADLKRDMAILATSGRDWSERTKRLAARVPDLNIFSQGLVERLNGGWRITDKGRAVLETMEARQRDLEHVVEEAASEPCSPAAPPPLPAANRGIRRSDRRRDRRMARERIRANAS